MFNVGNYVQVKRSIVSYVLMVSVLLSCIMLAVSKVQQEIHARELSISELNREPAKDERFSFELNDQLIEDFKFEYQQILALNPNAFHSK